MSGNLPGNHSNQPFQQQHNSQPSLNSITVQTNQSSNNLHTSLLTLGSPTTPANLVRALKSPAHGMISPTGLPGTSGFLPFQPNNSSTTSSNSNNNAALSLFTPIQTTTSLPSTFGVPANQNYSFTPQAQGRTTTVTHQSRQQAGPNLLALQQAQQLQQQHAAQPPLPQLPPQSAFPTYYQQASLPPNTTSYPGLDLQQSISQNQSGMSYLDESGKLAQILPNVMMNNNNNNNTTMGVSPHDPTQLTDFQLRQIGINGNNNNNNSSIGPAISHTNVITNNNNNNNMNMNVITTTNNNNTNNTTNEDVFANALHPKKRQAPDVPPSTTKSEPTSQPSTEPTPPQVTTGYRGRGAPPTKAKEQPQLKDKREYLDRLIVITVGKHRGRIGQIKSSGHGFYLIDLKEDQVQKRFSEFEVLEQHDPSCLLPLGSLVPSRALSSNTYAALTNASQIMAQAQVQAAVAAQQANQVQNQLQQEAPRSSDEALVQTRDLLIQGISKIFSFYQTDQFFTHYASQVITNYTLLACSALLESLFPFDQSMTVLQQQQQQLQLQQQQDEDTSLSTSVLPWVYIEDFPGHDYEAYLPAIKQFELDQIDAHNAGGSVGPSLNELLPKHIQNNPVVLNHDLSSPPDSNNTTLNHIPLVFVDPSMVVNSPSLRQRQVTQSLNDSSATTAKLTNLFNSTPQNLRTMPLIPRLPAPTHNSQLPYPKFISPDNFVDAIQQALTTSSLTFLSNNGIRPQVSSIPQQQPQQLPHPQQINPPQQPSVPQRLQLQPSIQQQQPQQSQQQQQIPQPSYVYSNVFANNGQQPQTNVTNNNKVGVGVLPTQGNIPQRVTSLGSSGVTGYDPLFSSNHLSPAPIQTSLLQQQQQQLASLAQHQPMNVFDSIQTTVRNLTPSSATSLLQQTTQLQQTLSQQQQQQQSANSSLQPTPSGLNTTLNGAMKMMAGAKFPLNTHIALATPMQPTHQLGNLGSGFQPKLTTQSSQVTQSTIDLETVAQMPDLIKSNQS